MDGKCIIFDGADKGNWFCAIARASVNYKEYIYDGCITVVFNNIHKTDVYPFHLVTLACLLQRFKENPDITIKLKSSSEILNFLSKDLRFQEYFSNEGTNYIPTDYKEILNLWRIIDDEKDSYSYSVVDFLKREYFKGYDLSGICGALQELYYNVFDHANANGNAFSMLRFDEKSKILYVAVCDLGIGIAKSVREYDNTISSDKEAILKALETGFTVHSNARNRGYGLDNIVSASSKARIISKKGFVYVYYGERKGFDLSYSFDGTLIYLEYDLNNLSLDETIDDFSF